VNGVSFPHFVQASAEEALKSIWFKHATNAEINRLMEKGVEQLQRPASLPEALETFEQAVKLDPMFAESWNKVATVMFLQRRWVSVYLEHIGVHFVLCTEAAIYS
jgi:hypothetical protein